MSTFIDSVILVTDSPDSLILSVECGYGQPVFTSMYHKKPNGGSEKLLDFEGNIEDLIIGERGVFQYSRLEVHSTIHDMRDFSPEQEVEDINLYLKIAYNKILTEVHVIKKTPGMDELLHCIYEVTIL